VDGLWHRRLRAEPAFAFPEQAARFPPENYKPVQNLWNRMKWMRHSAVGYDLSSEPCLLSRPASLGKNQPRRDNFSAANVPAWNRRLGTLCVMDACLCIQSVPKGQHQVYVTQDHSGRPIILNRIR